MVPFTEEAEIDCSQYSILLERAIVDFGADLSFGQAAEKLKEHYGISVPVSAIQTITKQHAEACYELQEKDTGPDKVRKARCLVGQMDGVMTPIVVFEANKSLDKRKWRKVGWKEARLSMAIEHKSFNKIFLATIGSTERTGDLLNRCLKRLGCVDETKIHCVGDGAAWIQEQVERVLGTKGNYLIDFFHLSEYLSEASEKCCTQEPKEWLKRRQDEMKEGRIEEVVEILKSYGTGEDGNDPVKKCLRYIENRPGQFKYKEALAEELPIGSGEIESANRSVIQKRLKIPGAWWKPETVEWMLALRCMRINGDWERYWHLTSLSFTRAA